MRPIVTDRLVWSVGLSVCYVSEPCKTDEPIEMPFGLRTRVGQRNHVLDGGPDPSMGMGYFEGEERPVVKSKVYGHCAKLYKNG